METVTRFRRLVFALSLVKNCAKSPKASPFEMCKYIHLNEIPVESAISK